MTTNRSTTPPGTYAVPQYVLDALRRNRAKLPPEEQRACIDRRIEQSGLPSKYRDVHFDRLDASEDPDAHRIARQYADEGIYESKPGLLLMGRPGCGKTSLMAAIMRQTVVQSIGVYSACFLNVPQTLDRVRRSFSNTEFSEDPLSGITSNNQVGLDDFGKGKRSEWVDEQFYNLIDSLDTQSRRVIITTNLTDDELIRFDEALVSRILGMCTVVPMGGRDYRIS
jgi:DNA replication protein DnaC